MSQNMAPRGSFMERLQVLRELGWRPVNLGDDFQPRHIQRAAREVVNLLGDAEPRPPRGVDFDQLVDRVRAAWGEHAYLATLNKWDLRHLPWILFYPPDREESWLGDDPQLVRQYGRWLAQGHRPHLIIALLHQYLANYPMELSTLDTVRALLRDLILDGDNLRLQRWRDRCKAFQLLEGGGPERMATAWWDSRRTADQFLAEAGFTGGLDSGKFVQEATAAIARRLGNQLAHGSISSEELARGLAWIERDGALRFAALRIPTAEALLAPFERGNASPEIEAILRPFFLRCYGDPRLPRSTGWANIDERYKSVMRRWLVRLDLDDFFRLLDKTALDRQWQYRKTFWSAYLERDLISDTWIVLGSQAATIARRTFEHGDRAAARLLSGPGVLPNHSVLLMRLGRMTVAEWSHMGKCRFWLEGNRDAPAMYREKYRRTELVSGAEFEQVHVGAERGRWQGRISDWIYQQTGVRISSHNYMPSGGGRWH